MKKIKVTEIQEKWVLIARLIIVIVGSQKSRLNLFPDTTLLLLPV